MCNHTNRDSRGFTLIEIVVVMVLISIIAAAVFSRSIATDQMNFRSQFDKIRNQVRYPQSIAMKRNQWWGFTCDTNTKHYWIFTGTNKDDAANQRHLPGQEDIKISLNDLGVAMDSFTVVFNGYGIPFKPPDFTNPTSDTVTVNVTGSGSNLKTFTIEPRTGLVR